jgi:DNA-binding transcriptional MerR regulator
MHRLTRLVGLLTLSVAFLVPTLGAQDKKDDPKKDTKDVKTAKNKGPAKDWSYEIQGKITAVDVKGDKESFTVQMQYKIQEPNPQAQQTLVQQQQQLAQQQAQLAQAKTPQNRQQILQQIANTLKAIEKTKLDLVRLKDVNLDFKCQNAPAGMRVRHFNPPAKIDETTGEFLKYSKEDLEKMRADGHPGYPVESKMLAVGQTVRVYFDKDTKTPASLYPTKDKKGPVKKADDLQDEINNFRYDVVMVVIMAEPPPKKN